ncbi:hypothetical protein J15TS10_25230 [Paenibacillus woosongensis]|uniref:Uncharacterized protein n=1 Tax=Paenibacillus woosongensis TaxID=307580 RepID=A0ABQ4MRZ6_9BACL|nr:hypothetical protein J15TS10_25230 [Paenibacillus woosongensis]
MPPTDWIRMTKPASAMLRPSSSNTYIDTSGHMSDPPAELTRLATRKPFTSLGYCSKNFNVIAHHLHEEEKALTGFSYTQK